MIALAAAGLLTQAGVLRLLATTNLPEGAQGDIGGVSAFLLLALFWLMVRRRA